MDDILKDSPDDNTPIDVDSYIDNLEREVSGNNEQPSEQQVAPPENPPVNAEPPAATAETPPITQTVTKKSLTAKELIFILKKDFFKVVDFFKKDNLYMDVIIRLFAAYFLVSTYNLFKIHQKFSVLDFPRSVHIGKFALLIAGAFVVLTFIKLLFRWAKINIKTDGYVLAVAIMGYGLKTVYRLNNFYYAVGVSIVVGICIIFLLHNGYFKEFCNMKTIKASIIVGIVVVVVTIFVASICVYRYLTYATSCFDFGIFCQMYYNMIHTLLPDTTCERNELLSHFAIHTSPIYYLLLPVYAIFPDPKTLLISQAVIVVSGVIPLWFIAKNFKFSNGVASALCIAYVFSPALLCSTFFDFHENKFLVPLLLWLLWAIDTNHVKLMYMFSVLCLMVKEDAFIYVVCVALYVITSGKTYYNKKKQKTKSLILHGIIIMIISLAYFFTITKLMEEFGRGVMEYRYSNLMMEPDKGLVNVVKTVLLDPAIAISEAFEEEKFTFFLQMTLPLFFLPFMTKKVSHLFLIIPFLLVNLMSDYAYQTQIGYQYVCGVTSMLIYVSLLNLSEMGVSPKKYFATFCMTTSIVIGFMYGTGRLSYYDSYKINIDRVQRMDEMIDLVPDDASVDATTYFVPQLSQRKVVYNMISPKEKQTENTDFAVLKVGGGEENFVDEEIAYLKENGYEYYNGYDDLMYLFAKTEYLDEHPELRDKQLNEPDRVRNNEEILAEKLLKEAAAQ